MVLKMHAPLVFVLGSASVVGAAGMGGGSGGVPSIERATGYRSVSDYASCSVKGVLLLGL